MTEGRATTEVRDDDPGLPPGLRLEGRGDRRPAGRAGVDRALSGPGQLHVSAPFLHWGTPIVEDRPRSSLADGDPSGADQARQVGQYPQGLHYFPIAPGLIGSRSGLLCVNHGELRQDLLHPSGPTCIDGRRSDAVEVATEIAALGVSIVQIGRNGRSRDWDVVRSRYNRRITGATPVELAGPARGSSWVRTRYSPDGTLVRGTLGAQAHGCTPWDSFLACEETWASHFVCRIARPPLEMSRYGVSSSASRYRWEDLNDDECRRFDATPVAGAVAGQDYRNEPNAFGWVVEIDPFDPRAMPRKRTALGRLAHAALHFAPPVPGEALQVYLLDGSSQEYLYRFVTRERYYPGRTRGDCLDDGVLYVAAFDRHGVPQWRALDFEDDGFRAAAAAKGVSFEDQADVLVNTRTAADVVDATPAGRAAWFRVVPAGEVLGAARTPNGRTLFVPAPRPAAPDVRHRAAIVAVSRHDGEPLGAEAARCPASG